MSGEPTEPPMPTTVEELRGYIASLPSAFFVVAVLASVVDQLEQRDAVIEALAAIPDEVRAYHYADCQEALAEVSRSMAEVLASGGAS